MTSKITYRNIKTTDTELLWELMNQLDYETRFMMYEPGERTKNLTKLQGMIDNVTEGNSFMYLAVAGSEIVGYILAQRGNVSRIQHSVYIVVGIREKYQHQGIGTTFFHKLDEWALENNIVRMELSVMCPNKAAVNLYQKSGFEIEGIKKKSMCIDGKYIDEYYMSKILG